MAKITVVKKSSKRCSDTLVIPGCRCCKKRPVFDRGLCVECVRKMRAEAQRERLRKKMAVMSLFDFECKYCGEKLIGDKAAFAVFHRLTDRDPMDNRSFTNVLYSTADWATILGELENYTLMCSHHHLLSMRNQSFTRSRLSYKSEVSKAIKKIHKVMNIKFDCGELEDAE